MTARSPSAAYRARRLHRYLGLFIGIQFLLWTVGGVYFSWNDIDEVHGDQFVYHPGAVAAADAPIASPGEAIAAIARETPVDSVAAIDLVRVMGRPAWRIRVWTHDAASGTQRRIGRMADGETGALRPLVDRAEAERVARAAFLPAGTRVLSVDPVTEANVGGHHEYREQPLPAWAVRFDHPSRPTLYVPAEAGLVQRVRHDQWRVFDFLWMLHTMDFRGRDDLNNLVLRAFSLLGIVTVGSGFVLFALTSPMLRRRGRRRGGVAAGDLTPPFAGD